MGGGVFEVFLGGTPELATFLDWFYSNQTRYVFRSAYWINVFDKLFGYQYHLPATLPKRLNSYLWYILSFRSPVGVSMGQTRRKKKDIPLG